LVSKDWKISFFKNTILERKMDMENCDECGAVTDRETLVKNDCLCDACQEFFGGDCEGFFVSGGGMEDFDVEKFLEVFDIDVKKFCGWLVEEGLLPADDKQ